MTTVPSASTRNHIGTGSGTPSGPRVTSTRMRPARRKASTSSGVRAIAAREAGTPPPCQIPPGGAAACCGARAHGQGRAGASAWETAVLPCRRYPRRRGDDGQRRARRAGARRALPRGRAARPRRAWPPSTRRSTSGSTAGRPQGHAPRPRRGPRVRLPLRPRGPSRRPGCPTPTSSSVFDQGDDDGLVYLGDGVRPRTHGARRAPRARPLSARAGARRSSSPCCRRSRPRTTPGSCTATSSPRTS